MPIRALKEKETAVRRPSEIFKASLSILKGRLPRLEYNHVRRLVRDGTERDLVFMQGITTGIQLAALDKKEVTTLLDILKAGMRREQDGKDESLLEKAEMDRIDSLLKSKFNLNARKRILHTLSRADSVVLGGLTALLKKVYRL
jgi:hypothetical protein